MTLEKLKKNSDFKRVYENGRSVANKYLVLYVLKNNLGTNRVGFSISKKVGKAVKRNRIRRLLNEVCRLNFACLKPGWDMIIIVRPRFVDEVNFRVLKESVIKLLKKNSLYKEED